MRLVHRSAPTSTFAEASHMQGLSTKDEEVDGETFVETATGDIPAISSCLSLSNGKRLRPNPASIAYDTRLHDRNRHHKSLIPASEQGRGLQNDTDTTFMPHNLHNVQEKMRRSSHKKSRRGCVACKQVIPRESATQTGRLPCR